MAFAVMGTKIGPLEIEDANSINTSFPSFVDEFNKMFKDLNIKKHEQKTT